MARSPTPSCRTCGWRKEERLSGHHYLHDRVVHSCAKPDQPTILGVDWLPPDEGQRLADLKYCDYYQPASTKKPKKKPKRRPKAAKATAPPDGKVPAAPAVPKTAGDCYRILGVSLGAPPDGVKKAYRRLAFRYHPDRNMAAGAEEKFKEVAEAYRFLCDSDRRFR